MTRLLKGNTNKKKHGKSRSKRKYLNADPVPWKWGEEQHTAFENLKKTLTSPPCLSYPNFDDCFILHCDASRLGLGCALYQKDKDSKFHPIAFGSRSLSQSEQNYSAHKLEFLALKWAITSST